MLKFLGSGLALAIGVGAGYYWWTQNGMDDDLRHAGDHLKDTGKDLKKTLDQIS